jgi:hypothetical protein
MEMAEEMAVEGEAKGEEDSNLGSIKIMNRSESLNGSFVPLYKSFILQ